MKRQDPQAYWKEVNYCYARTPNMEVAGNGNRENENGASLMPGKIKGGARPIIMFCKVQGPPTEM